MKKNATRLALALVVLALLGVAAGEVFAAGGQETGTTAQAVTPVDWFINLTWYKYGGDWGKDKFSQEVEKRFGLKLNFVLPAQEGGQQISTMIASGTLTDLLTVESWLDYRPKMAKGGLLWAYDDLIAKYDPSFQKSVKQDIFNWYKEADNKTYGLPNFAYSRYDLKKGEKLPTNPGFVLRSDIYAQIGKPAITSPESYLAALEKVKNDVKSYQGKSIIPMQLYEFNDQGSGSVHWLDEYFAVPFEDKSGKWQPLLGQEKQWEVLKFLNDAYSRGLISPENFSENRDTINQKVASGRVFSLLAAPQDFMQQFKALYDADNKALYEGFVVKNYEGDAPVIDDISGFGWLTTSVSKNAKAPDKIVKFLHWLNSEEGQARTFFGWEGETFTWNKDKTAITWTPEYGAALKDNTAGAKWGVGFMLQQNWLYAMNKMPKTPPNSFDAGDEYRMKAPAYPFSWDGRSHALRFNPDDPRNDEMRTLSTKIGLYWGKTIPKIITAGSAADARALWQDTVNQIKGMGLDTLAAYQNDQFQATKKALGYTFAWPANQK